MERRKNHQGREIDLGELITHVCKRPEMYTGYSDINLVASFIEGFAYGSESFSKEIRDFNFWLAVKIGFPRNWAWWDGLKQKYPESHDALNVLPEFFNEFRINNEG